MKTYLQSVYELLKSQNDENTIFHPDMTDERIKLLAELIVIAIEIKLYHQGLSDLQNEVVERTLQKHIERKADREKSLQKIKQVR